MTPISDPPADLVMAQVDRVCKLALSTAASRAYLLRFLVQQTLAGNGGLLSRRYIFSHCFKKRKVKGEATISHYRGRLQKDLERYYSAPTIRDHIHISLQQGSFVPRIGWLSHPPPFVGRDDELRRFNEFRNSKPKTIWVVAITGPAGIGKSTLGSQLLEHLRANCGVRYVVTVVGPDDSRSDAPYSPFHDAVVKLIGHMPKGRPLLRKVAPSWANFLLGPSNPKSKPVGPLPSELGEFLHYASEDGGIAIFLDNFHRADPSTARMISELTRTTKANVTLVVGYRETEARQTNSSIWKAILRLANDGVCLDLRPAPLNLLDVGEFVNQRFPNHVFPPRLSHELLERTGGVPLYLVELCLHLEESGDLNIVGHHWNITRPVDEIISSLPQSQAQIAAASISSLSQGQASLLDASALIGDTFRSDVLSAVVNRTPQDVEQELHGIASSTGLIYFCRSSSPTSSGATYRFGHSTYRDIFVNRMAPFPALQREWALRAVEALLPMKEEHGIYAELALLSTYGGRIDSAIQYYLDAADQAAYSFANGAAIRLCRKGLALLAKLESQGINIGSSSRRTQIQLHNLLGLSLLSADGFASNDAHSAFLTALELSRLPEVEPIGLMTGLFGHWVCLITTGRLREALAVADELSVVAEELRTDGIASDAKYAIGTTLIQLGHLKEATDVLAKASDQVDLLNREQLIWLTTIFTTVNIRCQMARARWLCGEVDLAWDTAKDAVARAADIADPQNKAVAYVFLSELACLNRRPLDSLRYARTAIDTSRDCGASEEYAWAQMIHAYASFQNGNVQEGLKEFEASFEFYGNARVGLTEFSCYRAEALIEAGRPDEATVVLQQASEYAAASGESYFEPEIYRLKAEALIAIEGTTAAKKVLELIHIGLDLAYRTGARSLHLRLALSVFRLGSRVGFMQNDRYELLQRSCEAFPAASMSRDFEAAIEILAKRPPCDNERNRGQSKSIKGL